MKMSEFPVTGSVSQAEDTRKIWSQMMKDSNTAVFLVKQEQDNSPPPEKVVSSQKDSEENGTSTSVALEECVTVFQSEDASKIWAQMMQDSNHDSNTAVFHIKQEHETIPPSDTDPECAKVDVISPKEERDDNETSTSVVSEEYVTVSQAEGTSKMWAQMMIDSNKAAVLAKQEQDTNLEHGNVTTLQQERVSEEIVMSTSFALEDESNAKKRKLSTSQIDQIVKKDPNSKRPTKCTICGKQFSQAYYCHTHMLSHSENNPQTCLICARQFTSKANLARHLLIHSDVKPYSCDFCGQGFRQKVTMMQHRLVHTSKKQNNCHYCGKRFADEEGLQKHLLVHESQGPIVCEICGKEFIKEYNRKRHMLIHSGDRPYECMFCGKNYRQRGDMTKHTRKVHGVDAAALRKLSGVNGLPLKNVPGSINEETLDDSPEATVTVVSGESSGVSSTRLKNENSEMDSFKTTRSKNENSEAEGTKPGKDVSRRTLALKNGLHKTGWWNIYINETINVKRYIFLFKTPKI